MFANGVTDRLSMMSTMLAASLKYAQRSKQLIAREKVNLSTLKRRKRIG